MQKFSTLQDAIALAEFAHRNQLDKAGMPYIEHPKRVLAAVQAQGVMPYVQIAAILHDVVEDTPITIDMISKLGFSEASCIEIDLLTKKDKISEDDYYKSISKDGSAIIIKTADVRDNLSEWRLSYLSKETQKRLREKYNKALILLSV